MMDTNVLGNMYLFGIFTPMILKGQGRKVMTITSGFGDIDWTNELDLDMNALYSISKAAANMVTAKFNAQYKKDNVLFVSICPGFSDVDHNQEPRMTSMISYSKFWQPWVNSLITMLWFSL